MKKENAMKNSIKKLTAAVLAIITVLTSLLAFGCSKEEELISLLDENGESLYAIYRPDLASDDAKDAGAALRKLISEKCGVRFEYGTDDKFGIIKGKKELLVGNTNRDISKAAAEGLSETQFRFFCDGESIAIVAGNDELLPLAVEKFVELFVTENSVKVPAKLNRTWECEPAFGSFEVKNPILDHGADPYVTYHNGLYYYVWNNGHGVAISAAESLEKITYDGGVDAYTCPSEGMWSADYWAPELFYINGAWYIYVAADDGENANHRMYVMKCENEDPIAKPNSFEFVGKVTDPTDNWAIDGTILQVKDELYFVWSGWKDPSSGSHQNLYIAHMSDPTTIDSERVLISSPTNAWEGTINEGPMALYYGDNIYIVYSGNGSWTADYCLGYLRLEGDDPMVSKNWVKNPTPFLVRNKNAVGPGHCSVVPAPDGSQWIVYHANLPTAEVGWNGRSVWIQQLEFNEVTGKIKLK